MSEGLDRTDALEPGHGRLEILAAATPDFIGGRAEYEHRLEPSLSLFAEGWAGWASRPGGWQQDYGVVSGARWSF